MTSLEPTCFRQNSDRIRCLYLRPSLMSSYGQMDWLLPRSAWLQLLRGPNGVAAAMDSMRSFFVDPAAGVTPLDAFHSMWHLHCSARQAGDPALLLLLVMIGRLERQLASTLLLSDPRDVAHDLKAFACVAEQWRTGGGLPSASYSLWIQLLDVTTILLSTSAASSADEERIQSLQNALQTYGSGLAPGQEYEDQQDEESMSWDEFMALGAGLDHSALLRTKDGRRSAEELMMITTQQQTLLSSPEDDPIFVEAMEIVWDAATIFMKCSDVAPETTATRMPRVTGVYHSFCDEVNLANHVHAASGDVLLLPPSQAQDIAPLDGGSTVFTTNTLDLGSEDTFIEDQMRGLEAIEDKSVLCIRVASLLGLQLQRGTTFAASVSSTRSSQWEQSVRKAVNSLTSADSERNETRQLLVLAAVHPDAVIDMILGSAITSSQHHEFFNLLLLECPLLARWTETPQGTEPLTWKGSMMTATLSRALHRTVSEAEGSSPIENSAVFRFILCVSSPPASTLAFAGSSDSVAPPDACMQYIFWPVLESVRDLATPTPAGRLFTLIRCFVDHVHTVKGSRLSSATIQESVKTAIAMYAVVSADDSAEYQELQDSLLLTTESLLRAWSLTHNSPECLTSGHHASIDGRLRCLLASHGVLPSSLDESSSGDKPSADGFAQMSSKLLESIQESLWRLVWGRDVESLDSHLKFLNRVRQQEYVDLNRLAVTGASMVQNQVAGMLQSSGGRLFDRIVRTIDKYITSRAEHPETAEPPCSPLLAVGEVKEMACSGNSSQETMEYVLRCSSVVVLSSVGPREESVARMLDKTISLIDQTVESARADPKLLLRCLQAAGLLYSLLRTDPPQIDTRISNRIEVTATRVLFLLKQIQSSGRVAHALSVEEAHTRSTVAAVLVSSGLVEIESIVSFLRSNN